MLLCCGLYTAFGRTRDSAISERHPRRYPTGLPPRTIPGLIAWAKDAADASDANARALRTCRARLERLNLLIIKGAP